MTVEVYRGTVGRRCDCRGVQGHCDYAKPSAKVKTRNGIGLSTVSGVWIFHFSTFHVFDLVYMIVVIPPVQYQMYTLINLMQP